MNTKYAEYKKHAPRMQIKNFILVCMSDCMMLWNEGVTVSDVAMWLKSSKPSAEKLLAELHEMGLISARFQGNKRVFTLNTETRYDREWYRAFCRDILGIGFGGDRA